MRHGVGKPDENPARLVVELLLHRDGELPNCRGPVRLRRANSPACREGALRTDTSYHRLMAVGRAERSACRLLVPAPSACAAAMQGEVTPAHRTHQIRAQLRGNSRARIRFQSRGGVTTIAPSPTECGSARTKA